METRQEDQATKISKRRQFLTMYEAWFGKFPVEDEDPGIWDAWWDLVDKIPATAFQTVMKAVSDGLDRRIRPGLHAFWLVWRTRSSPRSTAHKEVDPGPMFDFGVPGFPRRRDSVIASEDPRPLWRAKCDISMCFLDHLPPEFVTGLVSRLQEFRPEWGDFSRAEQKSLLAEWKIRNEALITSPVDAWANGDTGGGAMGRLVASVREEYKKILASYRKRRGGKHDAEQVRRKGLPEVGPRDRPRDLPSTSG